MMRSGAHVLCDTLHTYGVTHVFGVAGSETIALWEALRRQPEIAAVVPTHELGAAFMANGYARATGRPGVVFTIPGPGFTYALTGLAEARLDSVPIVHVVPAPRSRPDGAPALQAIPQRAMAAPLVKDVIEPRTANDIAPCVVQALTVARSGEPGPVLLQVPASLLDEPAAAGVPQDVSSPALREDDVHAVAERLIAARRPLLLLGQGAASASEAVLRLVETLPVPVLTTTSGRGVLREDHPWCFPCDAPGGSAATVNELLDACDLIVVAGCGLNHNGSRGYSLRLPPGRLVRVDTSAEVLERAYPASLAVEADAPALLHALVARIAGGSSEWGGAEVEAWRARLADVELSLPEQVVAGRPAAEVFHALRRALSSDGIVTTDSGLHQYLVRRHFRALASRTLIVPSDYQSMGFGIPAAIGASLATGAPVVAVVGDGGIALSGLELVTAVALGVPLVVIVLVDRAFGLIRLGQLARVGHESGVALPPIDIQSLASACGAEYRRLEGDIDRVFADVLSTGRVTVVEATAKDGDGVRRMRRRGRVMSTVRSVVGPGVERRGGQLRGRNRQQPT